MKIRVTSTSNLISFLKKLKVVDKSVLLELTEDKLFSKVHTPDKSVMKYAGISNDQIFESIPEFASLKCERIKIGLMDVTRLMDCFKHFRTEEDIFIDISTSNVEGECVATELQVVSASLKIKLRCADLSLLSYVEDKILSIVHSKDDSLSNFKIYNSDFSSLISLCGMESNSEELLVFRVTNDTVKVTGDSFDYKLNIGKSDITSDESADSSIYKSHLNYVDTESCLCYIHENRIVFFSDQTDTSTAVGVIEK
jgi:hypothetical protein